MKRWMVVVLLLLRFLNVCTEIKVSCRYNSSCLLPCNYKTGTATILHWNYMTGGDFVVHSFYYGRDQLDLQDPRYKGRTSLVEDQDTGGTTELQLNNVKVQDEGKYQCFADSDEHGYQTSTVVLEVDAPVQRVAVVRAGNSTTCSSEGVYPEPELTWSSSPQSSPTVQQTEEKLYSISSSLELSDVDGDQLLSCTVSTRLNKRTTRSTWRNPIVTSTSRAQISCVLSSSSLSDSALLWRFNHRDVILRWSSTDGQHVSAQWEEHVEAEKASHVLHLHDLSSDQEGTYSCELIRAEETTATHTLLRVHTHTDSSPPAVGVAVAVTVAVVIAAVIVYAVCRWKRSRSGQSFFQWACSWRGQMHERGRVHNNGKEAEPMRGAHPDPHPDQQDDAT